VWLYTGEVERLGERARSAIEHDTIVVSPIVELELTYLHEMGRLAVGGAEIVADLRDRIDLRTSDAAVAALVHAAASLSWTRDPFDRLIVADALVANASLLTKDDVIHANFPLAVW
jgi:PIN domain nuclease of toxin-antitoxin system